MNFVKLLLWKNMPLVQSKGHLWFTPFKEKNKKVTKEYMSCCVEVNVLINMFFKIFFHCGEQHLDALWLQLKLKFKHIYGTKIHYKT
jgi:hypothetical protein